MIPTPSTHHAVTSGAIESLSFDISQDDSAHIMTILREGIYTDKVMAVLREYSSNAWDSHRMSGKPDLPIHVTLPTPENKFLVIRDFGTGMTPDIIRNVFVRLGSSLKRDTDQAVGMLGIGAKSGFCYADSFEVTSWTGGTARTYVAAMDESNKGVFNLLLETPSAETGVEIRIAVRSSDVQAFHEKARSLFEHFVPRPVINTVLPAPRNGLGSTKSGLIFPVSSGVRSWTAVMGCVPYRLNMDQIPGVADYLKTKLSGVLYFDIGEVSVSASREELKYSDKTINAVVAKLDSLLDEFSQHVVSVIQNDQMTDWQKRWSLASNDEAIRCVGNTLPSVRSLLTNTVSNDEKVFQCFIAYRGNGRRNRSLVVRKCDTFSFDAHTKFCLVQNIKEYSKNTRSPSVVVFVPVDQAAGRDHKAALEDWFAERSLTGAPVITMDQLVSTAPKQPRKSYNTIDGKSFVFCRSSYHDMFAVNQWKAAEIPTDERIVLLPIDRFKNGEMAQYHGSVSFLAETLKLETPKIFGVRKAKFSDKLFEKYPKAISFAAWKEEVAQAALASSRVQAAVKWYNVSDRLPRSDTSLVTSYFKNSLPHHPVTDLLVNYTDRDKRLVVNLRCIAEITDDEDWSEKLWTKYPLLRFVLGGLNPYVENREQVIAGLIDYIKTIDDKEQPCPTIP